MASSFFRFAVTALLSATATLWAGRLVPTSYLSFSSSPFNGSSFRYFYLEDFEDGFLNTPGVSVNAGVILNPSFQTDSVDADDGAIDGSGTSGRSFFTNGLTNEFVFQFDALTLGTLPTHAGLVWTDVGEGPILGTALVEFEAFDANGISLGVTAATLGDGLVTGETAEDRFFGFINAGGLSRIEIRTPFSTDWEVDHLQYGAAVPEPATFVVVGVILCGLFASSFRVNKATNDQTIHAMPLEK